VTLIEVKADLKALTAALREIAGEIRQIRLAMFPEKTKASTSETEVVYLNDEDSLQASHAELREDMEGLDEVSQERVIENILQGER